MADDLDDGLWLEDDNVTVKGAEKSKPSSEELPPTKEKKRSGKRKAQAPSKMIEKGTVKKKKNSESTNTKKFERKRITDESEETLSRPGNGEDVKAVIAKVMKDKIDAEALEDILPDPENDFYPHNMDLLEPSKYLALILPKWKVTVKKSVFMKKNGSPALLIITSSAIRAVELNRQIKNFLDGKCKVAKLFAKHMKIEDQKKFLSKTNCQVGIGTPGRLQLLIKQGALELESLVAVVLDWNWRDTKLKRMADIPEIRQDLVMLLKDFIVESVKGSPCKLALL